PKLAALRHGRLYGRRPLRCAAGFKSLKVNGNGNSLAFDLPENWTAHIVCRPGGRRARTRAVFRSRQDVVSKNPGRLTVHD
ncbi:hypothetical protein, partial [Marilutibacter maris]|uniref:hypothetical protein n=1 Tax=Marilutibacter maris TaxID=1605891 RepID=UPI001B867992